MEFNKNSWFARHYLMGGEYSRPQTICELISAFVAATVGYLAIIILGLLGSASSFTIVYYRFDLEKVQSVVGLSPDMAGLVTGLASLFFVLTVLAIVVRYVVFPLMDVYTAVKDKREELYWNEYNVMRNGWRDGTVTSEQFKVWYEASKSSESYEAPKKETFLSKLGEVIHAVYLRVQKKTCVMISWK